MRIAYELTDFVFEIYSVNSYTLFTYDASLMVQSHETSLPIVDVGHPQLVLQGSYSWPDAVVGLRPRAFRLMMTHLPLALLAFLALVVEGKVALVRMVATSLLLVVAALVTNLLVLAISAAWARA